MRKCAFGYVRCKQTHTNNSRLWTIVVCPLPAKKKKKKERKEKKKNDSTGSMAPNKDLSACTDAECPC